MGLGIGIAAERSVVKRRRRNDPEAGEPFGSRRGERSRMITTDDGAGLFVEETGPPAVRRGVVFVHSSAMRSDIWHYQMAGLGEHRLVFYDLRGHGLSKPKGDDPFSIKRLAADLHLVVESSGLEEVVVVGHSIGGMIALEYCRDRRGAMGTSVKGLVLLNSTYKPAAETALGGAALARLDRLARRPLDVLGTQSHRLDRLRKVVRPSDAIFWAVAVAAFGPQPSAKQIDFTYDQLAETDTDVLFDLIRSYRDHDIRDIIDEITVPVLVIGGTHDRLTIADASRYLADHLPAAELHLLDRCGHMSMLERHREVNRLLERFLDDALRVGVPDGRKATYR
ncbi:MAG: alpha/beta hydrolase [Actinomycetota bacterium]|nr:alpha/beta hydrolase [Actinomycetota bacterium]